MSIKPLDIMPKGFFFFAFESYLGHKNSLEIKKAVFVAVGELVHTNKKAGPTG